MGLGLGKALKLGSQFDDDPARGFTFIFGDEDTGTSTLAYSIVKQIPEDKKVYILVTEPPHNVTGIIRNHYPEELEAERFVVPLDKEGVVPLGSIGDFVSFFEQVLNAKDVGAIIIDALDSLRDLLYNHYSAKSNNGLKIWGDVYGDIKDVFFKINTELPGVPLIAILKEKEETKVSTVGGRMKVDKTGEIVPTIDNKKILRWASTRLRLYDVGKIVVTKIKGKGEIGDKYSFQLDENNKPIGDTLPVIFDKMRSD